MISTGDSAVCRMTVTDKDTALSWGSGTLPVLATPRMILLVEETACKALEGKLGEGKTSVGTLIEVSHVSASPVGIEVECRVEVVEIDRARIRFRVAVTDAFGDVGTGFHERFVVDSARFMERADSKLH